MTRRRVLIVHDNLAGWGAEQNLSRFAQFVHGDAFEVSFLVTSAKPSAGATNRAVFFLAAPRVRVNRYTRAINFGLKLACAIRWFLRHGRSFDYLLASNMEEGLICFLARKALGLKAKLLVYNQIVLNLTPTDLFMRAFIAVNKRADGVLCLSQALCDHLAVEHGVRSRMFVLPACIDLTQVDAQAREKVDEDWLLQDRRKTILFVGRLSNRQKRVDVLLEAVAGLPASVEFKLLLVGDGEDAAFLKRLAKTLRLEDRAYFLGYKRNPYKYYALADLFVLSSDLEGFGNVIIEAMACGVPVIATDCRSGPAEILEGGRWGVLVPTGTPKLLAGQLAQILGDEELSRDLRGKSLRRAGQFQCDRVFERFAGICEEIDRG